MIKVSWDQGFKRAYRKKVKNNFELKDRFWCGCRISSRATPGRVIGYGFIVGFEEEAKWILDD